MLDRMFLADEQQSLLRLRQDYEAELLSLTAEPPPPSPTLAANVAGGHSEKGQAAQGPVSKIYAAS